MNIRAKLTIRFFFIVAVILLFSLIAIYYSSSQYREREFYDRLRTHAETTADLLISVDQIDSSLLRIIDKSRRDVLASESITVYNYANKIIYINNDSIRFRVPPHLLDRIRLQNEVHWSEGKYEVLGITYYDRFNRFVVIAGATDVYGLRKLNYLRLILLIVFVVVQCVVAFSGWIYSGRALQPISRMVDEVNAISASNLDKRLETGRGKDEIARLAETFNSMLERLQEAFGLQKSFVANASHELKNPLTMITSQLEVALLRSRSPEEYQQTITSVLEDIRDLNSVAKRLLELTGLSSAEINVTFVKLRVDELLWQCKEETERRFKNYRVVFTPELPEDPRLLEFYGNESLIRTAFVNLMDNGCKFSPDHTSFVHLLVTGDSICISFSDNGIGITPEDMQHIFQPFFRGSNTATYPGHGIGLSIVDRIVRLHKMDFTVLSDPGKETKFTVVLPRKS